MPAPHIPTVREVLSDLARDNSRPNWERLRPRYEADLKAPALDLLDALAARLSAQGFGPVTTKLFRPYRDVRFSKDKTPYHTHLHMLWSLSEGPNAPGLFYGISPDYVSLGCGAMAFDKEGLTRWRAAVDSDAGALSRLLDGLLGSGHRLGDAHLKRVPAPYPQDHPRADLLRRKGFAVWADLDETTDETALWAAAEELLPVARWIGAHV